MLNKNLMSCNRVIIVDPRIVSLRNSLFWARSQNHHFWLARKPYENAVDWDNWISFKSDFLKLDVKRFQSQNIHYSPKTFLELVLSLAIPYWRNFWIFFFEFEVPNESFVNKNEKMNAHTTLQSWLRKLTKAIVATIEPVLGWKFGKGSRCGTSKRTLLFFCVSLTPFYKWKSVSDTPHTER